MQEGTPAIAGVRITVVGDDVDLRELIAEILGADNLVAICPRDCDSIADVAATWPQLIVLDLGVVDGDGVTGWDYLRQLRAHPGLSTVPVLVCSGDLAGLREHDVAGADPLVHALPMPFGADALEAAVKGVLARGNLVDRQAS